MPSKILKEDRRSKVILYETDEGSFVRKQYSQHEKEMFFGELMNLETVRDTGYDYFPMFTSYDKENLTIDFPFIGIDLENQIKEGSINQKLLDSLIENYFLELEFMGRLKKEDVKYADESEDPFNFANFVIDEDLIKKDKKTFEAIIRGANKDFLYFRYDPEASNYLINEDDIYSNDFGRFRVVTPLYIPSFFIAHMEMPNKNLPSEIKKIVNDRWIDSLSKVGELFKGSSFETSLQANLLEVYSYLLHHYLLLGDDPTGENTIWVNREIQKVIRGNL